MNEINVQESLFEDPVGLRFRYARERKRLSQEEVAHRLRIPVGLIDAIEKEDWARIGAPIYLRSHVGSYARLLEMPESVVAEVLAGRQAPPLAPVADASGARRMVDRGLLKLAYLVITVALIGTAGMLVSHFQASDRVAQLLPLDPPMVAAPASPAVSVPAATAKPPSSAPTGAAPAAEREPATTAMMASLAPSLPSASDAGAIVLRFSGPSWLDVVDAAGARIERGLVPAGSVRRYEPGQAGRITFGNAGAVEVSQGGRTLDVSAYRQAEVVRFAVSSQGQVTASGD